jgi:hypothetical protein
MLPSYEARLASSIDILALEGQALEASIASSGLKIARAFCLVSHNGFRSLRDKFGPFVWMPANQFCSLEMQC